MSYRRVRGLLVYRLNKSAFKALYGRGLKKAGGEADTSFSKDYLQLSQDPAHFQSIGRLLGVQTEGDIPLRYVWPGGSAEGHIVEQSADRPHLKWGTNSAPQAWRVTPNPNGNTVETLPGNPHEKIGPEASKIFDSIIEQCGEVYLAAIALCDEVATFHLRVYMTSPPTELEWAGIEYLPGKVQHVFETMPKRLTSTIEFFGDNMNEDQSSLDELLYKIDRNPNQLLVGPPGTGKSVLLQQLAHYVENPGSADELLFDPDRKSYNWMTIEEEEQRPPGKVLSLTLHPSFGYEDLVLGLRPRPTASGTEIVATPGPLVNMAHYAATHPGPALLILDEFNRTNTPAAFGDALSLLDAGQRGLATVRLPYSDLKTSIDTEFRGENGEELDGFLERFTLPPNLWIVGAMNTADRSIAPLDAAMRRRFTITEIRPDYGLLQQHLIDVGSAHGLGDSASLAAAAVSLLQSVNDRIAAVIGVDFELGHSNFWSLDMTSEEEFYRSLAEAFDSNVVQSLKLELQGDQESLATILLVDEVGDLAGNSSVVARWIDPPAAVQFRGSRRLEINSLADMPLHEARLELSRQSL